MKNLFIFWVLVLWSTVAAAGDRQIERLVRFGCNYSEYKEAVVNSPGCHPKYEDALLLWSAYVENHYEGKGIISVQLIKSIAQKYNIKNTLRVNDYVKGYAWYEVDWDHMKSMLDIIWD